MNRIADTQMVEKMITIDELWKSANSDIWEKALQRYWNFVKSSNIALEQSMEKLNTNQLRWLDAQGWYEFLRDKYFRWKYTANNRYATTTGNLLRYINENALDELHKIKLGLISLDPSDIAHGLITAQKIRGLGPAGASGLLSLLYPGSFGTIDQFAVKALRAVKDLPETDVLQRMNEVSLTTKDGIVLIQIMRRKAMQLNQLFRSTEWTPRKIDMILWTYGRQSDSPKVDAPKSQKTETSLTPAKAVSREKAVLVEAKVRGLGQYYPNGNERFEIHIAKTNAADMGHTIGHPMRVQLQIGCTILFGMLRSTVLNKYLWISATVYDQNSNRMKLVDVLASNGIVKNQRIGLAVDSGKLRIITFTC